MGDVIQLGERDSHGATVSGPPWGKRMTLEWLFSRVLSLTGHKATPVQLAICRVADGTPLGSLWSSATVRRVFGGARPAKLAPKYIILLAAIRGGKSLLAACQAIVASQTVPVEHLSPGDEVRVPVLSTEVDLAGIVFSHLYGTIMAIPELADLLIGKPRVDSLELRHPCGKAIEIKCSAMSRAGTTLVGRWLAGAVFDEAPRMLDEGAVKSLGESVKAIKGRMLPGAQVWFPGSPHAPFGYIYDQVTEHFGKPTETTCVIRATGPDLNPVWWTPDACKRQELEDEDVYKTDVLAEFADPAESLISSVDLARQTRAEPLVIPPKLDQFGVPVFEAVAIMDPATRGNAWTLTIVDCPGVDADGLSRYRQVLAKQWIGTKVTPLSPKRTLMEIAQTLAPYKLTEITTDQWNADSLRDLAALPEIGLSLRELQWDGDNKLELATSLATMLRTCRFELSPEKSVRNDLLLAKKRITQNGATLVLPKTGDGRHCDHLPPLMAAMHRPPHPPEAPEPPNPHGDFAHLMDSAQTEEQSRYGRTAAHLGGFG